MTASKGEELRCIIAPVRSRASAFPARHDLRATRRGEPMPRLRTRAAALALSILAVCCGGPSEKKSGDQAENAAASPQPEAPATSEPPVRGDWLLIHALADPESFNPLTAYEAGAASLLAWDFPPLIRSDNPHLSLDTSNPMQLP